MSSCNTIIPDQVLNACSIEQGRIADITIEQHKPRELGVTKVIYNYKQKTEQQIRDAVQLEIDTFLTKWPAYKFKNSKRHFNGTGGIELQLNFILK